MSPHLRKDKGILCFIHPCPSVQNGFQKERAGGEIIGLEDILQV